MNALIRCITLNIKGLGDHWFDRRFKAVVAGLAAYEPDILCLQEATLRRGQGLYNQALAVGNALGLQTCAFAPYGNACETVSDEQGGIAIVSRYPIRNVRPRKLPGTQEARCALFVSLAGPSFTINVATTHLSWKTAEAELRAEQAQTVLNEAPEPCVILGDFNAVETEPAIRLMKRSYVDAFRMLHPHDAGITFAKSNPLVRDLQDAQDRRLDYVFCPPQIEVKKSEVILNEIENPASDHYGVFVELEW